MDATSTIFSYKLILKIYQIPFTLFKVKLTPVNSLYGYGGRAGRYWIRTNFFFNEIF